MLHNPWFIEHRLYLPAGETSEILIFANDIVVAQYRDGAGVVLDNGVEYGHRSSAGAWFPAHRRYEISDR